MPDNSKSVESSSDVEYERIHNRGVKFKPELEMVIHGIRPEEMKNKKVRKELYRMVDEQRERGAEVFLFNTDDCAHRRSLKEILGESGYLSLFKHPIFKKVESVLWSSFTIHFPTHWKDEKDSEWFAMWANTLLTVNEHDNDMHWYYPTPLAKKMELQGTVKDPTRAESSDGEKSDILDGSYYLY